jgi:protein ImuB
MQRLARGDDPRPLLPLRPAPAAGREAGPRVALGDARAGALRAQGGARPAHRAAVGRGLALTRLEVQLRLDPRGEARVELPLARPTSSSRLLLDVFRERLSDLKVGAPGGGGGSRGAGDGAGRAGAAVRGRPPRGRRGARGGAGAAALEPGRALALRRAAGRPALPGARLGERALPRGPRHGGRGLPPQGARGSPTQALGGGPAKAVRAPRRAFLARLLTRGASRRRAGRCRSRRTRCSGGGAPDAAAQAAQPLQVELSPSGRIVAVRIGAKRHVAASVRGPSGSRASGGAARATPATTTARWWPGWAAAGSTGTDRTAGSTCTGTSTMLRASSSVASRLQASGRQAPTRVRLLTPRSG